MIQGNVDIANTYSVLIKYEDNYGYRGPVEYITDQDRDGGLMIWRTVDIGPISGIYDFFGLSSSHGVAARCHMMKA